MEKKDTLVLGGHEFTSRFILGSGKFSVDLIKAAVEQGAAQIVTMALRRVEAGEKDNILDFIPKDVTLLPNTSSARTAEEASASLVYRGKSAAATSSKSKSCATQNTSFPTITKRSRLRKSSPKKVSSSCPTCILTSMQPGPSSTPVPLPSCL